MASGEKTKEVEDAGAETREEQAAEADDESTREELAKLLFFGNRYKKTKEREAKKEHKFWKTQPVPHVAGAAGAASGEAAAADASGGAAGGGGAAPSASALVLHSTGEGAGGVGEVETEEDGPIEVKTLDDVSKDPLRLPAGFTWVSLDVNKPSELAEVHDLLANNYVEDDDCMFRFDYSPAFLRWYLGRWFCLSFFQCLFVCLSLECSTFMYRVVCVSCVCV
jgi:hypothetical protein